MPCPAHSGGSTGEGAPGSIHAMSSRPTHLSEPGEQGVDRAFAGHQLGGGEFADKFESIALVVSEQGEDAVLKGPLPHLDHERCLARYHV